MDRIGDREVLYYVPWTDIELPWGGVNNITILNAFLVMLILFVGCRWAVRRFAMVPGRAQYAMELYTGVFDTLVSSSLEFETREKNRKYFHLIASLFLYLVLSNFFGFIPGGPFEEPTGDINCTLGLGAMGVGIALYSAIRVKGAGGYFKELLGPMWETEGAGFGAALAGKLSALFFLPLNLIGELAKVISISFRLFGNIIGGSIILVVVMHLVWNFSLLSIGMDLFFVFFVGTVQAFVFTMLTLTYIAVAIK